MSLEAMSAVWDAELDSRNKFVLMALADNADHLALAWPSVAALSRKTCMPERTVQRALAELRAAGLIVEAEHPHRGAVARTTCYRITLVRLREMPTLPRVYTDCPPRLRREVIEAFARTCAYCAQPGTEEHGPDGKAWHIDRVVPGSQGGAYEPSNVTLACAACNLRKAANTAEPAPPTLGAILAPAPMGVPPAAREGVPPAAPKPEVEPQEGVSTASPTTHRRAATASSNGDDQQQLGGMPPPRVPPRQAGVRDPLWDLMVEEFGKPPHDDARGRRNRALRMIRQALHGDAVPLTSWPDVLRARIAAAREQWGARGIYVTDIAVANQWQLLGQLVAAGDSDGHVTPQQMFDEALERGLQL